MAVGLGVGRVPPRVPKWPRAPRETNGVQQAKELQEKDTQFELCICIAVASDTYIDSLESKTTVDGRGGGDVTK